MAHEWWTIVDNTTTAAGDNQKSKERYVFLFKSRLLVCKVRRISDERSVCVLREIVRLPDVDIVEQADGFAVRPKSPVGAQITSTFKSCSEATRSKWLREFEQFGADPLAQHEHSVDDLRIDPTQIKADEDTDGFRLPKRIDAHEADQVRPSDVAQDYLPTEAKHKAANVTAAAASSVAVSIETSAATTVIATEATSVSHVAEVKTVKTAEEKQVEIKNQINLTHTPKSTTKTAQETKVEENNRLNSSQSLTSAKTHTIEKVGSTAVESATLKDSTATVTGTDSKATAESLPASPKEVCQKSALTPEVRVEPTKTEATPAPLKPKVESESIDVEKNTSGIFACLTYCVHCLRNISLMDGLMMYGIIVK